MAEQSAEADTDLICKEHQIAPSGDLYGGEFWGPDVSGASLRSLKALILARRAGMRDRAYEEVKNRYGFVGWGLTGRKTPTRRSHSIFRDE